MTTIKSVQFCNFDRRTQVIDPIGKVYRGRALQGLALRDVQIEPYTVVLPELVGWTPFNKLIQPASGGWALVEEVPEDVDCTIHDRSLRQWQQAVETVVEVVRGESGVGIVDLQYRLAQVMGADLAHVATMYAWTARVICGFERGAELCET